MCILSMHMTKNRAQVLFSHYNDTPLLLTYLTHIYTLCCTQWKIRNTTIFICENVCKIFPLLTKTYYIHGVCLRINTSIVTSFCGRNVPGLRKKSTIYVCNKFISWLMSITLLCDGQLSAVRELFVHNKSLWNTMPPWPRLMTLTILRSDLDFSVNKVWNLCLIHYCWRRAKIYVLPTPTSKYL